MSTATDPSICASEKRVSQWEELMRKFSRAHKEECRTVSLDIPRVYRSTKFFPTGSNYKGTWDVLGISGFGTYTFTNGVIYVGDFEDGMFHGSGQLRYKDGVVLKGRFDKGVMTERKLIFADGLKYEEQNWKYCKMPDRRYSVEYDKGLMPAGISNITPEMPPRVIPPGHYDTGDGFFNPVTKCVYKIDDVTAILRSPIDKEQKWIIANCRTAPEPNIGPSQYLYEKWSVPEEILPPPPEPASATRSLPSRQQSFYDPKDLHPVKKTFYDPHQWPFKVANSRWIYSQFIRPIESLLYADDDIYFKSLDVSHDFTKMYRTRKPFHHPLTDVELTKMTYDEDDIDDDDSISRQSNVDEPKYPELSRVPSIKFKRVHYRLNQLFKEKLMRPARVDNHIKKFTPYSLLIFPSLGTFNDTFILERLPTLTVHFTIVTNKLTAHLMGRVLTCAGDEYWQLYEQSAAKSNMPLYLHIT